jgi:hypothetical protein
MSLQTERIQLLMQRLGLTEMAHGYAALAEQAAQKNLPYVIFWSRRWRARPMSGRSGTSSCARRWRASRI